MVEIVFRIDAEVSLARILDPGAVERHDGAPVVGRA